MRHLHHGQKRRPVPPTLLEATRHGLLLAAITVLGLAASAGPLRAQDSSPPYVGSFWPTIQPASMDTGAGNGFLEILADLGDTGSGVNYIEAVLHPRNEDGSVDFSQSVAGRWQLADALIEGTLNYGRFSLLLRIPKGTPQNTFSLHSLVIYDAEGNVTRYFSDPQAGELALPATAAATVYATNTGVAGTNPGASSDSAPPSISDVQFFPGSVDVGAGQAFVELEVEAADDFSGVSQIDAWFQSPDGAQISAGGYVAATESVTSGGAHAGRFYLRVAIPADATPGTWSLNGVLVSDSSGKITVLSQPNKPLTVYNNGASSDWLQTPSNLTATDQGSGSVRIAWSDVNAGGAAYRVRMTTASGGSWQEAGTTATGATSIDLTGISNPLLAWFQVQAYDFQGASAWSSPFSASSQTGSYWSDSYGQLTYANSGANKDWVWSESLQAWLGVGDSNMHSADYGWLSQGTSPGWINSSKLGWIRIHSHGDAEAPSDAPWVWSNSFGWLISNLAGTGQYFWSDALQGWLASGSDGSLWSYDYGWLTPGDTAGWVGSSKLGWIRIHSHGTAERPSDAPWVWSNSFGWLISNLSGTGQFFWSDALQGWVASGSDGALWSYDYGWLTPGATSGWVGTSTIGWIYVGDFDGWVWSVRFGWVVSSGSGTATFFWSNSYGWLAAQGDGRVWSYTSNSWL